MVRESIDFVILFIRSLKVKLVFKLTIKVTCTNEMFLWEICENFDNCLLDFVYLLSIHVFFCTNVRREHN